MNNNFKNKTVFFRSPKDTEHPFDRLSSVLRNLNGYEIAIMHALLSKPDDWIVNKIEIQKKLKFPRQKFRDAWKSLEEKNHILCDRFWGGVKWVIIEDPSYHIDNESRTTAGDTTQHIDNESRTSSSQTLYSNYTAGHIQTNKKKTNKVNEPEIPEDLRPETPARKEVHGTPGKELKPLVILNYGFSSKEEDLDGVEIKTEKYDLY